MENQNNRPSVIVFNNLSNNNVIDIADSDDDNDLEILYESGPVLPISNQVSVIEPISNNEQENVVAAAAAAVEPEQNEPEPIVENEGENDRVEEPELTYEEYLARIRQH